MQSVGIGLPVPRYDDYVYPAVQNGMSKNGFQVVPSAFEYIDRDGSAGGRQGIDAK